MLKKRYIHAEAAFQTNVVRMLRTAGFYVFAVSNGWGKMTVMQAARAKDEGIMPGVSDLIILLPGGKVHFVELKNPNGKGRQSPAQLAFKKQVEYLGNQYHLWASWPDVEGFINDHRKEAKSMEDDLKVGGTD